MKFNKDQKKRVDEVKAKIHSLKNQQDKIYEDLLNELNLEKFDDIWLFEYIFNITPDEVLAEKNSTELESDYYIQLVNRKLWL